MIERCRVEVEQQDDDNGGNYEHQNNASNYFSPRRTKSDGKLLSMLMVSRAGLFFLHYARNFRERRGKVPRIVGYAETVVPLYSVDDFKDHFCLRRYTFEQFEKDISDCDELKFGGRGKTPVTVEKHALIFCGT